MNFFQGNASAVLMISEFTHVMLKVCVKLAALSAEWPGLRKIGIYPYFFVQTFGIYPVTCFYIHYRLSTL